MTDLKTKVAPHLVWIEKTPCKPHTENNEYDTKHVTYMIQASTNSEAFDAP